MIEVERTNCFKKEFKLMLKRGKNPQKFKALIDLLVDNANKGIEHHLLLPEKYCLHKLLGKHNNSWECHIEPDWLLIYYLDDKVLRFERTGTHSDIF